MSDVNPVPICLSRVNLTWSTSHETTYGLIPCVTDDFVKIRSNVLHY